jgi:serine phosphatase RsbU (regulator of sigma subunit)
VLAVDALPAKVLLVEDDDGDALLVREMLQDAAPQLDVIRARTLAEASDKAEEGHISCVLLDLGLPDAQGLEALTSMRDRSGRVPIIVLTGYDDEGRGIESLGAGAQEYLVKGDVDGSLILRAMRYAIERSHAEEERRELFETSRQAQENSRLERGLLPVALIRDPAVKLAAVYRPGRRRALLGGDFYDAIELEDGSVLIIVGDVCGHGPDEAALGVCLRIAWRALTLAGRPVDETLDVLDQVLIHERHDDDIFATAMMLRLYPDRTRADLYTAGHPSPILMGNGTHPRPLDSADVHPPLGINVDGASWTVTTLDISEGSSLLLYTDGLIEGRIDNGNTRLGVEGLADMIDGEGKGSGPDDGQGFLSDLIARVEALNQGELTDDLAVVLLSWG